MHAQVCLRAGLESDYRLLHADSLAGTLEVLDKQTINVILLDLNLPDSSGLDTFYAVKKVSGDAAVVIVSGESDERLAVSAVRSGAQDYIVKGPQFTASVLGRTVRFALERNARLLMETELRTVRSELEIADAIQQMLYPRLENQFSGVVVAGRCQPATLSGGDYFDVIPQSDGALLVAIGDVSGHGIGPAMMMVETRAALRVLAEPELSPGEVLNRVNRLLARDMQQHLFVTLFLAKLDADRRQLSYACAGHPGYLISPSGTLRVLEGDNPPLGITMFETFATYPVSSFRPGDTLALFTDGISEATSDHETFLGEAEAVAEIVRLRHQPAEAILDGLFALADHFNGDAVPQDDRTAVLLQTLPVPIPAPHVGPRTASDSASTDDPTATA